MILLPQVASRLFEVPLLVDARKAAAIVTGLGHRFYDAGMQLAGVEPLHHVAFSHGRPSMGVIGDELRDMKDYWGQPLAKLFVRDGVAVIPIEGTLVHKGAFTGQSMSGDTSYEGLQTLIRLAAADRSVKAVVFEIDSCGGEVSGAFDTADMIFDLSRAKPTLAILTDYAFSAGYLLASAARAIVMPETGGVGSIGVIAMHVDFSKMLAEEGIAVTLLVAGKHKADGNEFEKLPADVAARLVAKLDAARDLFAAKVGHYRGARFSKDDALATEALTYGAAEAFDLGMVDGIGRPSVLFDDFVRYAN